MQTMKKLLSILLAVLVLCVGLPMTTFAEEASDTEVSILAIDPLKTGKV